MTDFSRGDALRSLGPVIYAIRLDGGVIKIGFTTDLHRRQITVAHRAGSITRELLAFRTGTQADEKALHGLLDGHQARGMEYYYPTRRVLEVVNQMRDRLGLDPIAA